MANSKDGKRKRPTSDQYEQSDFSSDSEENVEGVKSEDDVLPCSKRSKPRQISKFTRSKASTCNQTSDTLLMTSKPQGHLTPTQKARAALHVGATPEYLPGRDEEFNEIETYLETALSEETGFCLYISGVPGTGKTATVRKVIQSLQERANERELKHFNFLEINGMKLVEPAHAFVALWEFISNEKVTSRHAVTLLDAYFNKRISHRDTLVVLVDELDQLVTKKNEVIYNFFNWPNQARSKLIVIAIANTMDLPERFFSSKIQSRLGSNRITFPQYNFNQLIEILKSRLEGLPEVIAPNGIEMAARKVASVTGDARRALDICRRTIERVEAEVKPRQVTLQDIVSTYKEITETGPAAFVTYASSHQKIMLFALSRVIRKNGIAEAEVSNVIDAHIKFVKQHGIYPIPSHADLFSVMASLAAQKLVTVESSRLDYYQRIKADVSDSALELILKQDEKMASWFQKR